MPVINTIEDLILVLDKKPEWVTALRARLLTRELVELPEKFAAFVAATNKRFNALQNDIGILRGAHARNVALEEVTATARDMGLRRTKTLTQDDLWDLIDNADTADLPTNELRSFRRADLIIEAVDPNGATCYIAVEVSFTANGRDTNRALRNAGFLARFTDRRAYAAIASLCRDDRIWGRIKSGEVFWYQLAPEALEAE